MNLNAWLNEFSPTKAIGLLASVIFFIVGLVSLAKWDGPPDGLQIFIFTGAGISFGGLVAKRLTDRELNATKGEVKVRIAEASARVGVAQANSQQQPTVTTTTEPDKTTTVVDPQPADDKPSGGE